VKSPPGTRFAASQQAAAAKNAHAKNEMRENVVFMLLLLVS
jgi:hypothetical protein